MGNSAASSYAETGRIVIGDLEHLFQSHCSKLFSHTPVRQSNTYQNTKQKMSSFVIRPIKKRNKYVKAMIN